MWRFRWSIKEILERQLLIRGRAFATFSTIVKALAGRMLCRPALVEPRPDDLGQKGLNLPHL